MKIGFDAKRAFYNRAGLGNYSRNTIQYLSKYYPDNQYFLFSPKTKNSINFVQKLKNHNSNSIKIVSPTGFFEKEFSSLWRTFLMNKDIKKHEIDIFHGLSNEIPRNIDSSKTQSIVTIHDLIFLRFPELYKPIDRYIYNKKFKYACQRADKIIAISKQSKQDIVDFYKINPNKIDIVYQGCCPVYYKMVGEDKKLAVKKKYNLPAKFILNVGTIEKRKNIFSVIKAIYHGKIDYPLVIVGKKTDYLKEINIFIEKKKISNKILFLHDVDFIHLPTIYQMSSLFIYPSIFEGFGIPIIEAINSKIPVITTNTSCLPEAGGEHSIYVEPYNIEQIADAIKRVLNNKDVAEKMIQKSYTFVQKFREQNVANQLMKCYLG